MYLHDVCRRRYVCQCVFQEYQVYNMCTVIYMRACIQDCMYSRLHVITEPGSISERVEIFSYKVELYNTLVVMFSKGYIVSRSEKVHCIHTCAIELKALMASQS